MKKFLFLISLAFVTVLAGCGNDDTGSQLANGQQGEIDLKKEIVKSVEKIINKDLSNTKVNNITVNKNMGLDDGSYIVLPHLVWNVKNSAGTTRDMLEMYSNHLAAKLAEEFDISEITVFWEVPYHLKGDNIAKFNYERSGGGMAIGEVWYAPKLR